MGLIRGLVTAATLTPCLAMPALAQDDQPAAPQADKMVLEETLVTASRRIENIQDVPMSVSALPMSICPQAMLYLRPSSAVDFVRPVIACLVDV